MSCPGLEILLAQFHVVAVDEHAVGGRPGHLDVAAADGGVEAGGLAGGEHPGRGDRFGPRALSGGVHGPDPVLVLDVAVTAGVGEVVVVELTDAVTRSVPEDRPYSIS